MKTDERRIENDAVSPVIGVILMVAITVIIAGVAGVFALGIGVVDVDPGPQTQFEFGYDESVTSGTFDADGCADGSFTDSNGELEIRHRSGESIEADNLMIYGAQPSPPRFHECSSLSAGDDVTVEDTAYVEASDDDVVRLVWENEGGNTSYTLGKWNGTKAT